MSNPEAIEDDVLLAYAVEPVHDLATLERYLQRYPQFTQGLIDCSLELEHSQAPGGLPKTATAASAAAWDRFQVAMDQTPLLASNPFDRLDSGEFRALANELNMNALLLMRLRDRVVSVATIPRLLVKSLAGKLGVGLDAMERYLSGMPAVAGGVQFKSAGKPVAAPQIDFAEAVRTSQLTAEQQEQLLALTD